MVKKLFLIIFLLAARSMVSTPIQQSFTAPLTTTGQAAETTFFVHDADHRKFVLKYHPRTVKRAIHDTLGAYVGKSIGLRINEVEIVPSYFLTPSQTGVTTVHSRVPGVEVRQIKEMHKKIDIKKGLYKQVNLDSITEYMDLCEMVAFDIFTDNVDRHNRNLFFDKKSGQFYAIDMDHSFKPAYGLVHTSHEYNFCTVAGKTYNFLESLKKKHLSRVHIQALKRIRKTLDLLEQRNSPLQLFEEWMSIAEKAHYVYNPREQEKIKKYLVYHSHEIQRLLVQLDSVIEMYGSQTTNGQKV